MAEDISPEAAARKAIDDYKAQLAQANEALKETLVRDRLTEHFANQGVKNPFEVATRAVGSFKDVDPNTPKDELGQKAQAWFDEQRQLFGGTPAEPAAPASPPTPSSPFAATEPNLTSPGLAPKATPIVVGSKEFMESGWATRPVPEQIEAMRRGDLVSSDKVKLQQREVNPLSR